jgi:hypothetical protein
VTGFPASLRRTLPVGAAFIKQSRMELAGATDANGKSGEAPNSTPSGSRMKRGFSQPAKWNDATMMVLDTGSAGHVRAALVRSLQDLQYEVVRLYSIIDG